MNLDSHNHNTHTTPHPNEELARSLAHFPSDARRWGTAGGAATKPSMGIGDDSSDDNVPNCHSYTDSAPAPAITTRYMQRPILMTFDDSDDDEDPFPLANAKRLVQAQRLAAEEAEKQERPPFSHEASSTTVASANASAASAAMALKWKKKKKKKVPAPLSALIPVDSDASTTDGEGNGNHDKHLMMKRKAIKTMKQSTSISKRKRSQFHDDSDEEESDHGNVPSFPSSADSDTETDDGLAPRAAGDADATAAVKEATRSQHMFSLSSSSSSMPMSNNACNQNQQLKRAFPNTAAASSSFSTIVQQRPRVMEETEENEDQDNDDEELYPTFANPMCLGQEKPLLLGYEEQEGGDGRQRAIQVPAAAARYLFDYQQVGVKWLYGHYKAKAGCILGDTMGLGKTIQIVCLMLAVFKKRGSSSDTVELRRRQQTLRRGKREEVRGHTVLVVCPSSVIDQWLKAFEVWGKFAVSDLRGSKDEAEGVLLDAWIGAMDIVVCSYEGMHGSKCGLRLKEIHWRMVVFDEFHKVKNKETQVAQAAGKMKALVKIGLTGTPVQNAYKELWALLSIVAPHLAGKSADFYNTYTIPINRGNKRGASAEVIAKSNAARVSLESLLSHVLLKRHGSMIADQMKGKSEYVVFCKLTPMQYAIYERVLALPEFHMLLHRKELCDCGRRDALTKGECCYRVPQLPVHPQSSFSSSSSSSITCAGMMPSHQTIDPRALLWRQHHPEGIACDRCPSCLSFAVITKLQKIANHPSLLQNDDSVSPFSSSSLSSSISLPHPSSSSAEATRAFAELAFGPRYLAEMGGTDRPTNIRFLLNAIPKQSGKLRDLDRLLKTFPPREKVLIFSLSVQMLRLLKVFATIQGYLFLSLDGSTPGGERQGIIDQFINDKSITLFFISTKAGGLGLNLTCASKVVIFDLNWNPSHDLQAMDRSYRLGQLRDVQVYRFVAQGTIEEVCYMRQIYKQQLNSLALEGVTVRRPSFPVAGMRQKKGGRMDSVKFASVQGIKGEEGELFGVENLLRLQKEPFILDVRKKFRAEEGRENDDKEKEHEEEEEGKGEKGLNVTSTKVLESQVRDVVETAAVWARRKGSGKGEKGNVDVECMAADIWGLLGVEVPEKEKEEEEGGEEVDEVDDDEGEEEEGGLQTERMRQRKKEKRREKQHQNQEVEEYLEEEVEDDEEEEETQEEKEGLPTPNKPLPAKLSVYKPAYVQKKKEAEEKKV